MSRMTPMTVIVNSSPVLDRMGEPVYGIIEPLKKADGKHVGSKPILAQPTFNIPKPLGKVSHWINEAAKRRCNGDMTLAKPSELVQVPVYRGTSARFMNEIKADERKRRRMSMIQRIKAEIASRLGSKQEGASA